MSLEKHVMSSAWTGLRRECLRPVAGLPTRLWEETLLLSVCGATNVLYKGICYCHSVFFSFSHGHIIVFFIGSLLPSLSLFVLVFLSHLGWNVTLFHVWAVCIPSVFLSINYWAIKFTFPHGKTVVVNLSRRHSRAQVGRWDDGIVGDDVWIFQCWSYFETGVWQVIHHLQLN